MPNLSKLPEISVAFLRLGLTSFGGPIAHLGYFHREFVGKRRWLDDAAYADIVALCQLLPGASSSQVAFAIGLRRAGLPGALAASITFLLPSAAMMILFAYGVSSMPGVLGAGWIHGLKLAAVAVVACALWAMGKSLCPDWPRKMLAAAAAILVLLFPGTLSQIGVIAGSALVGWRLLSREGKNGGVPERAPTGHGWALGSLLLYVLLLGLLPFAASLTQARSVSMFDAFYRSGSLVFGGGHVVLPLLRSEVVDRGWMGDDAFLAGYGAAQALPGPLFSFAGYLGTLIHAEPRAWSGGLLALGALFLPSWLLVGGAYPFWHRLRAQHWAQGALGGANAAVVGILLGALYRPIGTGAVRTAGDLAAAAAAVLLLSRLRFPPWGVVALMAAAGEWILR